MQTLIGFSFLFSKLLLHYFAIGSYSKLVLSASLPYEEECREAEIELLRDEGVE